ncbi:MAG TPA: tyrosinase family protein [Pyrinomonadaceae bacterium]|jgi:tyrosinase
MPSGLCAGWAIRSRAIIKNWGLTRNWNPVFLPSVAQMQSVMLRTDFAGFQFELERVHAGVHNSVGGQMGQSNSPADPLFRLHHSNIDRVWAQWQATPNNANPTNTNETLKPSPIIKGKVQDYLNIGALNYSYA